MDFTQVIETRRSIRKYQAKEIPDAVLKKIIHAALVAPTGGDKQSWHFYAVKNSETRKQFVMRATTQKFIKDAPVVMVCCADKRKRVYAGGHKVYMIDTIIAVDHLVLAARNEGVATCWVGSFDEKKVKEILNIPDNIDVHMLVPMGYPEEECAFTRKKEKTDLDNVYTVV